MSRSRRRRKAFDLVALAFGGVANRGERRRLAGARGAFERHDLIPVAQNLPDGFALALVQVVVVASDRVARALGHQLRVCTLARAHPFDRLAFEVQHRWCGERPPGRAWLLFNRDEIPSF